MKTIRILFTDFYAGFVAEESLLYRLLKERYHIELSDTPDYLIYSAFGNEHLHYNNCVKIFWTGENQSPDFNLCDYAIGFDYLEYGDRYLRYPLFYHYERDMEKAIRKHWITGDTLAKKTGFCSFVYSNHNASKERDTFYDLLSQYKKVDSGGKYRNNIGAPVDDLYAFQKKHKFAIAFENTSMPGYTTEKLLRAFAAQTVPIYWGNPRVAEEFNNKSFISCHEYASWNEVIKKVKELDNNPEAYKAMLQEPAFTTRMDAEETLKHTPLREFLYHIFDQELSEAKRYSRDYWNQKLLHQRIREYRSYKRSLYGIAQQMYNKIFYPLARKSKWGWQLTSKLMKIFKR